MKKYICFLIGLIPINFIKIFLFRKICSFDISKSAYLGVGIYMLNHLKVGNNSNVGHFNILTNDKLIMKNGSTIKKFNKFLGNNKVYIDTNVLFKSFNTISGNSCIFIGQDSVINSYNHFDLVKSIKIGQDVVFAGKGIEIWTHGYDHMHRKYTGEVVIGNNVYIGSGAKIRYNIEISDNITIGMGTVVSKDLKSNNGVYVSNNIRLVKELNKND